MLKCASSRQAKRDIKTRQHLSERSFAQSKRYGYKRARWRRLWRVKIQDFLIAALQNIQILISHSKSKAQSQINALVGHLRPSSKHHRLCIWPISCLKMIWEKYKFIFKSFCFFKPFCMEFYSMTVSKAALGNSPLRCDPSLHPEAGGNPTTVHKQKIRSKLAQCVIILEPLVLPATRLVRVVP